MDSCNNASQPKAYADGPSVYQTVQKHAEMNMAQLLSGLSSALASSKKAAAMTEDIGGSSPPRKLARGASDPASAPASASAEDTAMSDAARRRMTYKQPEPGRGANGCNERAQCP